MILKACIIMTYEKGQRMALLEPLAWITGDGEIDHLEYTDILSLSTVTFTATSIHSSSLPQIKPYYRSTLSMRTT